MKPVRIIANPASGKTIAVTSRCRSKCKLSQFDENAGFLPVMLKSSKAATAFLPLP